MRTYYQDIDFSPEISVSDRTAIAALVIEDGRVVKDRLGSFSQVASSLGETKLAEARIVASPEFNEPVDPPYCGNRRPVAPPVVCTLPPGHLGNHTWREFYWKNEDSPHYVDNIESNPTLGLSEAAARALSNLITEHDVLLEQNDKLREQRDALQEQLAAAEAALTKSEAVCDAAAAILSDPGKMGGIPHALVAALSVFATQVDTTLAARDREVAARTFDAAADCAMDSRRPLVSEPVERARRMATNARSQFIESELRKRAAALRSGTEGA